MKEMTELLHVSMNAIRTIDESHKKQAEVIQKTVSINQAIAEGIKNENEQFVSIRTLAENYTKRSCIFHTTSS